MISVLYVDDEPGMLDILKSHLEHSGHFTVDIVGSGHEALKQLHIKKYDAVLSDYQMPGMNGIAFLKAVREKYPRIPFIIFTGHGRENVVIDALNFGADFYLQKGSDFKSLYAELQNLLLKIVERKRLEEALRESETRYREFFTTSRDGVYISSPEGRWIDFNDMILELFGYNNREEFSNVPIPLMYANERDRAVFQDFMSHQGFVKEYPVKARKKDGTLIDVHVTAVLLRNPDASVKMYIGTIRDVTEQNRMIRALRESEERYRNLLENAPVGILTCDRSGKITYLNPRVLEMLGSPGKEMTEEINLLNFPLLVKAGFSDFLRRTLEKGETFLTGEVEYTSNWGKSVRCKLHISPLFNHGTITGAQVILGNVTQKQ